jgi:glycosyltransferase involved in cell wall biosynthesis
MVSQDATAKPIALLIPVRNRQAKLDRALRSVVAEAPLLKVIVIDDGSDPPALIDPALPLDVELIRMSQAQGVAAALNTGLSRAFDLGCPYIARLDSDDTAIEGRFRAQLSFLEGNPSVGICGTGYFECGTGGVVRATVRMPRHDAGIRRGMHLRMTLWHPTVMVRASVARRVGTFDPSLACEDTDYFLRAMDISKAANLPEPLIRYETGAADALTRHGARQRAIARDLLRLKWRRREPLNPLWWIGLVAGTAYLLGISRALAPLRSLSTRLLDRGPGKESAHVRA